MNDLFNIRMTKDVPPPHFGISPMFFKGDELSVIIKENGLATPEGYSWVLLTPNCFEIILNSEDFDNLLK